MGKPQGQRAFIGFLQSGEKFNLAISELLPLQYKTGIHIVTTNKIITFCVVTELIPLYMVLINRTGNSIDTGLNILPSIYLFIIISFSYL